MPSTHLVWSVIMTLCCCMVPGIVAIFYSAQVSSRYHNGDIAAAKTAAAYNEVLPSTGEYTPVDYSDANVTAVAKCAEGTVVEVSISGSQSMLALAIGVDNDGAITGVSVIDHGETPGLGAKSTEAAWRAQFAGQTSGLALDKKGGEIAPLTGATITSQAIVDACQIAIDTAANVG